jgi:hypothetical protein
MCCQSRLYVAVLPCEVITLLRTFTELFIKASYLYCSCMFGETAAKNIDADCGQWAEKGECAANPTFVSIRCPESCGRAVGWNPWVRRSVGIEVSAEYIKLTNAVVDILLDMPLRACYHITTKSGPTSVKMTYPNVCSARQRQSDTA